MRRRLAGERTMLQKARRQEVLMPSVRHWAVSTAAAFAVAVPVVVLGAEHGGGGDFQSYRIYVAVEERAETDPRQEEYPAFVSGHGVGENASSDTWSWSLRSESNRLWNISTDKSGVIFVRFQFRDKSGETVCDTGEKGIVLNVDSKIPVETGWYFGGRCGVN